MFFFERILDRISKSRYKYNIILKGGLLLSSIIGEDMRTTKDMDATLKSIPLEKKNVLSIMEEILTIDVGDNIIFEIIDIKDIREEDEYGGFKIHIVGKFERLKTNMFIELTTGDKITPKEIEFNYNCIFKNNRVSILAYNIETLISEKFETVISRNVTNTRLKDFYDLSNLLNDNFKLYNELVLVEAIKNTFEKRKTNIDIKELRRTVSLIRSDIQLKKAWMDYQKKYTWANEISFDSIIEKLDKLILLLKKELVII